MGGWNNSSGEQLRSRWRPIMGASRRVGSCWRGIGLCELLVVLLPSLSFGEEPDIRALENPNQYAIDERMIDLTPPDGFCRIFPSVLSSVLALEIESNKSRYGEGKRLGLYASCPEWYNYTSGKEASKTWSTSLLVVYYDQELMQDKLSLSRHDRLHGIGGFYDFRSSRNVAAIARAWSLGEAASIEIIPDLIEREGWYGFALDITRGEERVKEAVALTTLNGLPLTVTFIAPNPQPGEGLTELQEVVNTFLTFWIEQNGDAPTRFK